MKKILLLSVLGLILVGASVGITLWLTGAFAQVAVPEVTGDSAASAARVDAVEPTYITLDPPFTVTFNDHKKVRFLQIKMDVATRAPEVETALKTHMPVVRNGLVMLFSSQKPEELLERDGKERLRQQALAEIRDVLQAHTGQPGVDEVYFTSFIMQ
jgi:flagellar FliL protein